MSVREYIGARYIPLFSDPLEWDSTLSYEPLTVVKNQGSSYVSRQYVPEGVAITNENYWILWADFNAQLEQYRQEVQRFDGRITANANAISAETTARENADTTLQNNIDAEETARIAADTTLQNNIDAEETARIAADTTLQNNIDAEETARIAADNEITELINKFNSIPVTNAIELGYLGCFTAYGFNNTYNASNILPYRGSGFTLISDNVGKYAIVTDDRTRARMCNVNFANDTFDLPNNYFQISDTALGFVTYFNNFMYTSNTNGNIQVFDINMNLVRTVSKPDGWANAVPFADRKTNVLYAVDVTNGYIAHFDGNNYSDLISTLSPAPAQLTNYMQDLSAYDGCVYIPTGALNQDVLNGICVYDISSGELVKFFTVVDASNNVLPMDEMEGIDFKSDGTAIIAARTQYPFADAVFGGVVHTLWDYNFTTGLCTKRPVTSFNPTAVLKNGNNLYSCPGYSYADGQTHPFKSLAELSVYNYYHPWSMLVLHGESNSDTIYQGELALFNSCNIRITTSNIYIKGRITFFRNCNASTFGSRLRVYPLNGFNYSNSGLLSFDYGSTFIGGLVHPSAPSNDSTEMTNGHVWYFPVGAPLNVAATTMAPSGFTYQSICNQSSATPIDSQPRGRGVLIGFPTNTFPTV